MKIFPAHPFRLLIFVVLLSTVFFKFYSAFAMQIEQIAVNVYLESEQI